MRKTVTIVSCAFVVAYVPWTMRLNGYSVLNLLALVAVLALAYLAVSDDPDLANATKRQKKERLAAMHLVQIPLIHANAYALLAMERPRNARALHDRRRWSIKQFLTIARNWNLTGEELSTVLVCSGADVVMIRDVVEKLEREDGWTKPRPEWVDSLVWETNKRRVKFWTKDQIQKFQDSLYD